MGNGKNIMSMFKPSILTLAMATAGLASFASVAALVTGIINTVLAPYLYKLDSEDQLQSVIIEEINEK